MIDEVGIPDKIVFDGAKEPTGKKSEFMRLVGRTEFHSGRPSHTHHGRIERKIKSGRFGGDGNYCAKEAGPSKTMRLCYGAHHQADELYSKGQEWQGWP
jgi:hypothetical protein